MSVKNVLPGRKFATGAMMWMGIVGAFFAGMVLYLTAIVVVHEVFANAGVWDDGGAVFRSLMEFALNVPLLALGAYLAAGVVNGLTSYEFSAKRLVLSVVGLYSAAAAARIVLLSRGVV